MELNRNEIMYRNVISEYKKAINSQIKITERHKVGKYKQDATLIISTYKFALRILDNLINDLQKIK